MPDLELTDLSLLILADIGTKPTRTKERVNTLTSNSQGGNFTNPPAALKALITAGFVTIRATDNGYKIEITDQGLMLHRVFMTALRGAAAYNLQSSTSAR